MKGPRMTSHAYAPLELKDAEDESADIVTKALDDLTASVDERLNAIETKSAERFTKIEQKLARPNLATTTGMSRALNARRSVRSFAASSITACRTSNRRPSRSPAMPPPATCSPRRT